MVFHIRRKLIFIKSIPFSNFANDLVATNKLEISSILSIERKEKMMQAKNRCVSCFLLNRFCICEKIKANFSSNSKPSAKIAVFMHYKEFGRASNTGKILSIGLKSEIFIFGKDNERLIDILSSTPSLILCPCPKSVSISNFQFLFQQESISHNNGRPVICVLDSTWSQSKAMNNSLPLMIPRVHINDYVIKKSEYLCRKQNINLNKISTIESVEMAISILEGNDSNVRAFQPSLRLSVDALFKQSGKPIPYG